MARELTIAAVQFNIAWQDVEQNLRSARRAVLASSADLVVLPEMFATGFSMNSDRISQSMQGSIVSQMTDLARDSGRALIFSAAIAHDGVHYNRLFFITPQGGVERTYDKRHTFRMAGENEHYASGYDRVVVEYLGVRICTLICYDLRFPVFSRFRGDYDVLVYVASWPGVRSFAWRTLLAARAIENQAYVVGVNRVGDDPAEHYLGDTMILDFKGEPLARAARDEQETIQALVSIDKLEQFRSSFPAWRDADKFEIIT
ncbi:MAG: amidohydrolase [Mucinivorans sp.]